VFRATVSDIDRSRGGAPPSLFASTAASISSRAVATDTAGNLYFTNLKAVFEVDQSGQMTLPGSLLHTSASFQNERSASPESPD
jgi:hypothetical protein